LQVRSKGKVISEGIFDELAQVDEIVAANHWLRAWEGVRDLDAPPLA
jgi:hypothetical protein